jgi:hypothetical protein
MQYVDSVALEAEAWRAFVARLGQHLAAQWPAMPERLGERYDAFVELACQQAQERGLNRAPAVARYVNLCFVWGPGFQDKPGFEWASGLLAAPAEREIVTAHQLLQRSLTELQRMASPRVDAGSLAQSDARLMDQFGTLGRRGDMRGPAHAPMPRQACDLEAVEVKLLCEPALQRYALTQDDWHREPMPLPPALRADLTRPLPGTLAALSGVGSQGAAVQLQVRARSHAVCDADVHPALHFSGPHGRWEWAGHETRAVSWPLQARAQTPLPLGLGTALAEDTSPELTRLTLAVCGLRDEGDPVGSLTTVVSVWPAAQWWLDLRRASATAQSLLPSSAAWAAGTSRCRLECDGVVQDSSALTQQFQSGLDAACAQAVARLNTGWAELPGLSQQRSEVLLGLLTGSASMSWGWQWGAAGLSCPALMRFIGQFDLDACRAELQWGGELAVGGTRTRLNLQTQGVARLQQTVRRELAVPDLTATMMPLVADWAFPFSLSLEPIASDTGALLQQVGPVQGQLIGAAGLRPCTGGTSGWEWFVRLRLEPVQVMLEVLDPVLGTQRFQQPLLPETLLVDWSPR